MSNRAASSLVTCGAIPVRRAAFAEVTASFRRGLVVGAATLAIVFPSVVQSGRVGNDVALAYGVATTQPAFATAARYADFGTTTPSSDVRHLADWVADSRDNVGAAFVIVDKKDAKVYLFDARARLRASSPALLGAEVGDGTVPGIGSRPIALVRPQERTTPAGRFVGERGHDTLGDDVVWVDYDNGVAMHRVVTTNPKEHRLERLATPTSADNRISYGCINLPVAFYDAYIRPTFAAHRAIVYVLPDLEPVQQVFGSYDVTAAHALAAAGRAPGVGSVRPVERKPSTGALAGING